MDSGKLHINGVDLYYEKTGNGGHPLLLFPGALGQSYLCIHFSYVLAVADVWGLVTAGSAQTDFGPQLKGLNKERFTVVGWDPRGYGRSRPPSRDFPRNFFERDAKDGVDLMKVCPSPNPARSHTSVNLGLLYVRTSLEVLCCFFSGRLWALKSSLCWDGVTEASRL